MVKLNYDQQMDEIRDLENLIFNLRDLEIVEVQVQQLKRLIYFTKKQIKSVSTRRYHSQLTVPDSSPQENDITLKEGNNDGNREVQR